MIRCTIIRKVLLFEMKNMVLVGEASGTLEEIRKLATVYGDGGSYDKAALMEKVYQIQNRNTGGEKIHYPAARMQKR